MEYKVENEILYLYLKGQINSSNSEDVEKEVQQILTNESFKVIRIDMNDLDYISSAGLRIILKIKKQFDDTVLLAVPNNIFEILEMVGFTNIMTIEKK